jgi:hypothetical protein
VKLEKGKTYSVDHCRKGRFTLKVKSVDGEFVRGAIVAGTAATISMSIDDYVAGDDITVRRSFCIFREVK